MGKGETHKRRHRFRPTQGFWVKVGLALSLIAPALPQWLMLLLGLLILALPARLFEP
jgi:hypothetical protein